MEIYVAEIFLKNITDMLNVKKDLVKHLLIHRISNLDHDIKSWFDFGYGGFKPKHYCTVGF